MADMYGALCSNTFTVKDIEKFKTWFAGYYFGSEVELFIREGEHHVSFGSYEQYPCAHPKLYDDDGDLNDADLETFARELCHHLEDGEVFTVLAGGNEKLRYVSFDQLIIAQEHPDKPYYEYFGSDDDDERLIKLVLAASRR